MSTKKDKSVNIVGKIKEGINLISNFKPLDKDTDKEEIERLKKDKQNALKRVEGENGQNKTNG